MSAVATNQSTNRKRKANPDDDCIVDGADSVPKNFDLLLDKYQRVIATFIACGKRKSIFTFQQLESAVLSTYGGGVSHSFTIEHLYQIKTLMNVPDASLSIVEQLHPKTGNLEIQIKYDLFLLLFKSTDAPNLETVQQLPNALAACEQYLCQRFGNDWRSHLTDSEGESVTVEYARPVVTGQFKTQTQQILSSLFPSDNDDDDNTRTTTDEQKKEVEQLHASFRDEKTKFFQQCPTVSETVYDRIVSPKNDEKVKDYFRQKKKSRHDVAQEKKKEQDRRNALKSVLHSVAGTVFKTNLKALTKTNRLLCNCREDDLWADVQAICKSEPNIYVYLESKMAVQIIKPNLLLSSRKSKSTVLLDKKESTQSPQSPQTAVAIVVSP